MAAKITESIPPQQFEVLGDQLASVLGEELPNQYALDNTKPLVDRVWMERFIDFDSDIELPTVNVSLWRGDYGNETIKKADGEYIFNIDVYTAAPSSDDDGPGDQFAMRRMKQIAGMIMAILRNPIYTILGMAPGTVIRTKVIRFFVGDKKTVKDALSDVVGRIQFSIQCQENVQLIPQPADLNVFTTTVKLNGSSYGFYYSSSNVPPPTQEWASEDGLYVFVPENSIV